MKRRRAAVAISALLVALVLSWWGSEREPRFQGRSLSAWLMEGAWRPFSPWGPRGLDDTQREAVRAMGSNALPFLVKWMQYEPSHWRVRLNEAAPKLVGRFEVLFRDAQMERAGRSLAFLEILGPDVRPVLPELVKLMKQTNAVVAARALAAVDWAGEAAIPVLLDALTNRQAYPAITVVGTMGHLGVDGHYAVPALLSCLTNKDHDIAATSARLLGTIRIEPETAIPALMSHLDAQDVGMRYAVIQALGAFRGYARVAVPSLQRILSDPETGLRRAATNSIQMIESDFLFRPR